MPPETTNFGPNAIDLWNNELQTLRYHMMALVPGDWSTVAAVGAEDFDLATAVLFDLRSKNEVYRLPLHHCGNGVLDTDWFEQCDYAQAPPVLYPDDNTWKYENVSRQNEIFLVKDVGYFTCDQAICLQYPVDLCGDGYQSNGYEGNVGLTIPEAATYTNKSWEKCDDSNNVSGDGCRADCQYIEANYECPIWGQPCVKICGNGRRDQNYYFEDDVNGDPMPNRADEECDMGENGVSGGRNLVQTKAEMDALKISNYDGWKAIVRASSCTADCFNVEP